MIEPLSEDRIAQIVREVLAEAERDRRALANPLRQTDASMTPESARQACSPPPAPLHHLPAPQDEELIRRLVMTSSSLIGVGRTGCRFLTDLYLRVREGHADAKDAVHSEVPADWPEAQGLLPLTTRCRDRHEYLLFPNHGRRLEAESARLLEREGAPGADVQVIVGDGLSPLAILKNGQDTLLAVGEALAAKGFAVGRPLFVRFARIAVADEIGVLLKARATAILVGERPGLGTGDSLSIYIAVNPKLDQDNAQKNCISNVRPIGIRAEEAGSLTAEIIERGFARGSTGVELGFGYERQ